jgi:hypothetical protein
MLLVGLVVQEKATGPHVCYRFGKWGTGWYFKLKLPGGEPMKSANKAF